MKIEEIRKITNMSRAEFSRYTKIPLRTLENWEHGIADPTDYLIELLEYKIKNEFKEEVKD